VCFVSGYSRPASGGGFHGSWRMGLVAAGCLYSCLPRGNGDEFEEVQC
jgi:hypothetical protein